MKKRVIQIICNTMFAIVVSISSYAQKGLDTVKFKANVTCDDSKKKIEKNFAYEKGVSIVEADFTTKIITVVYRINKTNPDILSTSLDKMGYENTIIGAKDSTKHGKMSEKQYCKKEKACCKKPEKCNSQQHNEPHKN